MKPLLKLILALNLIALTVLVFVFPHLMVSPGKLIPGHKALETDCFACHAPLTGAASGRCVSCHKPGDIGRLTTTGKPVAKPLVSVPFHQKLLNQDCVACHSDHAGVKRLRPRGHFDHGLLQAGLRNECQTCHKTPGDALHKQTADNCLQCHSQDKWVPAKFDHARHFNLDRDHNTRCTTCHVANDYKRYTCYGCHEHTQENIRRKHIKEGIRDYSDCVECHRSADEHEGRGKNGERGRGDRKHNDD